MTGIGNEISDRTILLPITEEAHAIAHQFAASQPTPQKAEQVRLNILAVSVVNNYLQMMEIPTDIAASYSRQPFLLMLNNVADLMVSGIGRLECRPVKAHEQSCHVPVEVWDDRVGYIAVQMDEALEEAALVGFAPTVETEELPLSQFQPLKALLKQLEQLRESVPVAVSPVVASKKRIVNLTQWFENVFETGWQTVESLLGTAQVELAFHFRRGNTSLTNDTDEPLTNVSRAKLIHLGTSPPTQSVVIIVDIQPEEISTYSTLSEQKIDILVQVVSPNPQTYLPANLQLLVLDEFETTFLETQARIEDDYIQLQFRGNPEEKFTIKLVLSDTTVVETMVESFVI